jgi:hypothetical protein
VSQNPNQASILDVSSTVFIFRASIALQNELSGKKTHRHDAKFTCMAKDFVFSVEGVTISIPNWKEEDSAIEFLFVLRNTVPVGYFL